MFNSWKIGGLYDKFHDTPTIVLGGGPSINDFINEYKNNSNLSNALIICADAVLHKLLSNGIRPHIVTRCERKFTNIFKGVSKELTDGIYYAAYPWTPTEYFNLFSDSFYLFRQNGVCLFTELSHAFVDGGVSSGNAAMELAINLGSNNIILSGIDLCFIDGKSHTDGTQVEFNVEKSKEKWSKILDNNGNECTTIPVWERCRNEYMQAIDKHHKKGKKFTVINTSLNGAVIPLTEVKSWESIRGMFDKKVDISDIIVKNRSKLSEEEIKRFNDKLSACIPKLKEFLSLTDICLGLMEDAKKTCDREIYKLVEQIKVSAHDNYEMIKMLRSNQANYDKLWMNVADSIDQNFKQKLFCEQLFRILLLDVLQLDYYNYENGCNQLANNVEFADERCEHYYRLTKEFLTKVRIYLNMFIELYSK